MRAVKVIEFLAGAALILWGTLSIIASAGSEAQTNWLASGLICLAIGVALVWRAGRLKPALPRPAEEAPDAIQLPEVRRRQSKGRQGLGIAIFLTLLSIVICVSCIGLLVKAFQPVKADYALCYPSASVVVTECIGPWEPVQGMDSVLELYHSSTAPIPDAMYAYAFFLEVRPDLVQEGRELLIPSDGVRPSLFEVHAPMCIHSTTLKGRLAILRVEETALTAWLDIQGEGEVSDWKYTGEVTFKNAIPRQASGSTPTRSP